jgi:uncharacterized protein involved in type VI secretion and phage assembly
MATLQGVYSASVVDNRDPEGLGRVLVRVPGVTDASGGDVWARVATLMAGRGRGTWFIPETGDEVLVAFERGESRSPYVIGALWNSKSRPPATAQEAASLKLVRSRNGIALRIRDDTSNNSLVLETPGGQRITLQDGSASVRIEDGNGNVVTLAASGVTVQSSATVSISAGTAVELSASMVTINTAMSRFNGVVQCDTLISNSVVSASYSPGVGNIW